ncbi:MAG: hypothetical protein RsTaC01_1004 [Candidatus Paraimprobicoccus trichonymphae]|uniref:Bypass of forespore C C-terminal domain-containing protein n=1 Tax=Candidatus Paraimprobicoccus trichonymphae TaxID=3033793 RepID=A0AA48I522_9FIRM|nr:MAG: hypothetical protein RsTaC01_1004 [Candidatus Paraimprobicoccus trichonymphae]
MKKKTIVSVVCFLFVFFGLLYFFKQNKNEKIENLSSEKPDVSFEIETPKETPTNNDLNENIKFVVKEYKGRIAVFEPENPKPIKITDVQTVELSDEDQKLLLLGIELSNEEELSSVLEDYCS